MLGRVKGLHPFPASQTDPGPRSVRIKDFPHRSNVLTANRVFASSWRSHSGS